MIEKISWPVWDDEDEDEECSLDEMSRVAGYLRTYCTSRMVIFNIMQEAVVDLNSDLNNRTVSCPNLFKDGNYTSSQHIVSLYIK